MGIDVGVGKSENENILKAGSEAAGDALKKLGQDADVLIAFGAPSYNQQELLDGITNTSGETPLIGGTTAREISTLGLSINSVVVAALSLGGMDFGVGAGRNISGGEEKIGEMLASGLLEEISGENAKSLMVFPDGLAGDGLKIVRGCQNVRGDDFEMIGGALGDEQISGRCSSTTTE
ncbi:MAG: hypothetical protein B6U72_00140 [Candidatus Altiarchaeales archaeon ex4484_2]|nr:MAG: hypothetical protein B6U72_00140 [Candidatus Altiarchaeales archaeon ex4484_2]